MTGPRNREEHVPTCLCGHNQRRHELAGFDGECVSDGCGCNEFRPREISPASPRPVTLGAHTPARPNTPAGPSGTTIAQLVAAGKQSAHKRTVTMAERVETYARDLAARLRAERELAVMQARLEADRALPATPMPGLVPLPTEGGDRKMTATPATCEDCGETFPSGHKKGAHRRRKHPRAVAS